MLNGKGQIFSLDFIFSVMVMVLAIGLAIQMVEVNQYTSKEIEVQENLARIGETAADMLVSHPDIACDLVGSLDGGITYSPAGTDAINCISWKNSQIKKETLGIPDNYGCWVGFSDSSLSIENNECTSMDFKSKEDVYSASRYGIYSPRADGVDKKEIQKCMNNDSCGFEEKILTIKVWKE